MQPAGEYDGLRDAIDKGRDDIVYFAEQFLGMPLHEGQRRFLAQADQKTNTLVPANRWGKSTVIAIKHIHHCFYKVGIGQGNEEAWGKASYTTVNLSPHSDTTRPVFDAILQILRSSFRINEGHGRIRNNVCQIGWFLDEAHIRNTPPLYIPFINNSDILFRSTGEDQGKSIEGRTYGYISYDEGGQSHHLGYERTRRILPRLGELNGHFDLVSTPELSSPSILEHYELFQRGGGDGHPREDGFYSQEGSILENEFFLNSNPGYIKSMEEQLGNDPILQQILYGKFVFAGDTIFPTEDIMAAKDEHLDNGVRWQKGHSYIIGVDTAIGEDECVYLVLDTTDPLNMQVVRMRGIKGGLLSPQIHQNDLLDLFDHYNQEDKCRIILETYNGESKTFYLDLPPDVKRRTSCFGSFQPNVYKGMDRSPKVFRKAEMLIALRKLLADKSIKIPNEPNLIKQLSIYREDDERIPTDRVIALCLAAWQATGGRPRHPQAVAVEVEW
jgi:hypothetical protein